MNLLKFMKKTSSGETTPCYVNIDSIVSFFCIGDLTYITLNNGTQHRIEGNYITALAVIIKSATKGSVSSLD